MKNKKSVKTITPPESLYRVKVETSPMYPSFEKFWHLEVFDADWSNQKGEVIYRSTRHHGLAITKWGLNRAVKKAIKKSKLSYAPKYTYL